MSTFDDWLRRARSSPAGFAALASAGEWVGYEHLLLLDEKLEAAARGEIPRLIVAMPPRHGKSELISRYTPAWFLGRFPNKKVLLASYEARFAATWGRKARQLLEEYGPAVFGVRVSSASAAAESWEIADHSGAMATAGVGGPLTGKGAHLLIIDDPVKNSEEAASEVIREKHWDWWRSTARTRLQKNAAVVLVMTRWHEDDLAGRLLEAAADGQGDEWELLELPAIAEPDEETGAMEDALGRAEGDALCRGLGFDEPWMADTRRALGTYWFWALYQQKPRPAEGLLFRRADFRYFRVDAEQGLYVLEDEEGLHPVGIDYCTHFMTADTAASEDEMADYSVISTWAVTPESHLLLVRVERERFEDTRVGAFLQMSYDDADVRPAFVTVENASSGPKVIRELGRKGYPIRSAIPDTDKVTRALLAVARYEEHRVFHRRGAAWLADLEAELLAFPNAAHDDQVDTVSYAAIELPRIAQLRRSKRDERPKTEMGGLKGKRL